MRGEEGLGQSLACSYMPLGREGSSREEGARGLKGQAGASAGGGGRVRSRARARETRRTLATGSPTGGTGMGTDGVVPTSGAIKWNQRPPLQPPSCVSCGIFSWPLRSSDSDSRDAKAAPLISS